MNDNLTNIDRRDFLVTTALGAGVTASLIQASASQVAVAEGSGMKITQLKTYMFNPDYS